MTEAQLVYIGIAASILVWVFKFIKGQGWVVSSGWMTGIVYVVSGALAWLFAPLALPALPPFVDLASFVPAIVAWVGDLLVPLSAFVGFATLVYNALLKLVLDGVGARFKAWRARG